MKTSKRLWRSLRRIKKALLEENASFKAQVLSTANDLKQVTKSPNDLEQYARRDCAEIRGIPFPEETSERKILMIL